MAGFYHHVGPAPQAPCPYYVLLATPCTSHPECVHEKSMVATAETLTRAGIQFDYQMIQGSCHVDDVRNGIIRNFLQWERPRDTSPSPHCRYTYTDLFFLDADMGWDAKSVVDLLMAPGDIVAGVYRHKHDDETYPFAAGQFTGLGLNEAHLFEMPKVATGFMRIRRPVLQKLYDIEKDKKRSHWADPQDREMNPYPVARIVERGWPRELGIPEAIEAGNDYQSGDYVLCLKARMAGFKVFVDPDMKFHHAGEKVWTGHFGNHLRQEQGVFAPAFIEAIEALRAGKAEPATFAALFEGWDAFSGRSPIGNPWTLEEGALAELWGRARGATAPVLEMGSGLTTLVLGLALEGTGQTAHALECHLESWRKTAATLERFDIKNVVLHHAPLEPIGPKPEEVAYGGADLPEAFGLVLVDGPYHSAQRRTALWALRTRIRGATLLIDDVGTCAPLMEMLEKAGHAIDLRQGGKKRWAIAAPPSEQLAPAVIPATKLRPLIVSLTSHPPRFGMLSHTLGSLLNQDVKPDAIVLWLAREELAALPSQMLRIDGITVRQCEQLRSYKKLIPALKEYPGHYIVTADDDLVYPRSWLRDLTEGYRGEGEIVCRRTRKVSLEPGNCRLASYNAWPILDREAKGDWVFPTSCHGMLVPPGALRPEALDMARAQALCPNNDDIWWWWMAYPHRVRNIVGSEPIYDLPTGKDGLWSEHNRDGGNDVQIAAMTDAFGLPWAPVREAAE
jgi:hypothetical protein